jgi:hypothetical protein
MPIATVTQAADVTLALTDQKSVDPPAGDRPADIADDSCDTPASGADTYAPAAARSTPSKLALLKEERRRRLSESLSTSSPAPVVEPDLEDLAGRINASHRWGVITTRDAEELVRRRLKLARSTGEMLAMAKARVAHGLWEEWVRDHCIFDVRMARNYRRIFDRWEEVKALIDHNRHRIADFTIDGVLRALAKPRPSPAPAPPAERAGFDAHVGENEPPEFAPPGRETIGLRSGPGPAALEPPPAEPAGSLALPGPAGDRDEATPDAAGEGSARGDEAPDDPEPVAPSSGPATRAEPTPCPDEAVAAHSGLAGDRPDRCLDGDHTGPDRPATDLPATSVAPDIIVAGPAVIEPPGSGLDGPTGAAVLDELAANLRAAVQAFRRIPAACGGDPWKVTELSSASEAFRERAAELLRARTPRALGDCPLCQGEGLVSARPCGRCAGVGSVLVD